MLRHGRLARGRGIALALRRRADRSPRARHHLQRRDVAHRSRRHGGLRAYAALERLGDVYHARDAFGASVEDTGLLFDHLVPLLRRLGATAFSFSFLGAPSMERMLDAHRFEPREATRAVVADARPGDEMPALERWYLTDGDEDTL